MCDEGRYGFGWIDKGRLTKVRDRGVDATWEQAIAAIAAELTALGEHGNGSGLGVIASAQLTNEELFLIREIFAGRAWRSRHGFGPGTARLQRRLPDQG